MPGSPDSSTTWPSPSLACSKRSSSMPSSCCRPTSGVSPVALRASNRLSARLSPTHPPGLDLLAEALELVAPEIGQIEQAADQALGARPITTSLGPARACSRAARFGVSPTTACSCAAPSPIRSPTTTSPVAMPIADRERARPAVRCSRPTASMTAEPGPDGALGVVLVRVRIAEIDEHAVAHVLGDEAVVAADRVGDAAVIGADHLAQVLGIEPRRQRRRADQVAEHHGELAPLGLRRPRGWGLGSCRRGNGP